MWFIADAVSYGSRVETFTGNENRGQNAIKTEPRGPRVGAAAPSSQGGAEAAASVQNIRTTLDASGNDERQRALTCTHTRMYQVKVTIIMS